MAQGPLLLAGASRARKNTPISNHAPRPDRRGAQTRTPTAGARNGQSGTVHRGPSGAKQPRRRAHAFGAQRSSVARPSPVVLVVVVRRDRRVVTTAALAAEAGRHVGHGLVEPIERAASCLPVAILDDRLALLPFALKKVACRRGRRASMVGWFARSANCFARRTEVVYRMGQRTNAPCGSVLTPLPCILPSFHCPTYLRQRARTRAIISGTQCGTIRSAPKK